MIQSLMIYSLPIFLAALGGYLTDKAGILNIAIEGLILCGAFITFIFIYFLDSIFIAVIMAAVLTGLLSAGFAGLTMRFKGNIFITGLAMNLLIPGVITLISKRVFLTGGVLQITSTIVTTETLVLGFLFLSCMIYLISIYLLKNTQAGLLVRATGLNRRALEVRGGNPSRVQVLTFLFSGFMCGLSGAMLTLTVHAYVPNISSGKGWLALAAIYLGNQKATGLIYAVLFFAIAEVLANLAQGTFDLPSSLFVGFPYLVTFIGLIIRGMIDRTRRS
mgnify:CR=1 FL=1